MIYISVLLELKNIAKKFGNQKYAPGGWIVITDDAGDAVSMTYSRKKFQEICITYYQNPECKVLIDPYVVDLDRYQQRFAHQELGFALGVASMCKLKCKVTYKRSYYRYFGLNSKVENAAYNYCIANYPTQSFLYKMKDQSDVDKVCMAYLLTRFHEAKMVAKQRYEKDIDFILEELDDGNEDCDV